MGFSVIGVQHRVPFPLPGGGAGPSPRSRYRTEDPKPEFRPQTGISTPNPDLEMGFSVIGARRGRAGPGGARGGHRDSPGPPGHRPGTAPRPGLGPPSAISATRDGGDTTGDRRDNTGTPLGTWGTLSEIFRGYRRHRRFCSGTPPPGTRDSGDTPRDLPRFTGDSPGFCSESPFGHPGQRGHHGTPSWHRGPPGKRRCDPEKPPGVPPPVSPQPRGALTEVPPPPPPVRSGPGAAVAHGGASASRFPRWRRPRHAASRCPAALTQDGARPLLTNSAEANSSNPDVAAILPSPNMAPPFLCFPMGVKPQRARRCPDVGAALRRQRGRGLRLPEVTSGRSRPQGAGSGADGAKMAAPGLGRP
ncbi:basic proline-rich protein-like [Ammospiza nelsoni]|uniref:basic proline-rich protein-like n=1 Tax=Ammospiza nelsoni TaxID=2857394 RepID=UPI00286CF0B7|nr:basic proline-rich protein-like [Ammospiza nelsoni]